MQFLHAIQEGPRVHLIFRFVGQQAVVRYMLDQGCKEAVQSQKWLWCLAIREQSVAEAGHQDEDSAEVLIRNELLRVQLYLRGR
jgi:hypothetical protein